MPNINNTDTNTTLNAKINEVEKKIPSTTNLATNFSVSANKRRLKTKYLILLYY